MPAWFSRLDPRYRTPVGSILFAGIVGIVLSVLANVGAGNQEAFQLLDNTGGILFALTYLVMFAIPLMARGEKPTRSVRWAAMSGFIMTLLYVVTSVFPIIDVQNPWTFTAKIVIVVGACNAPARPITGERPARSGRLRSEISRPTDLSPSPDFRCRSNGIGCKLSLGTRSAQ
jgi:amino acid transporter